MQIKRENREIWLGNRDFRIQRVELSQNASVATNEHNLLLALISMRFSSKSAQSSPLQPGDENGHGDGTDKTHLIL